jgi:hypothetical protein
MTITISQIEAELQTELLICSECQCPTKTIPAENVPAQALRYGISCDHLFFMELPAFHQSEGPPLWRPDGR